MSSGGGADFEAGEPLFDVSAGEASDKKVGADGVGGPVKDGCVLGAAFGREFGTSCAQIGAHRVPQPHEPSRVKQALLFKQRGTAAASLIARHGRGP